MGWYAATLKLHRENRRAEALLREMRRAAGHDRRSPIGWGADDTLDRYERAVEEREPLAVVYTQDPNTAPLHSNPRWKALLEAMGLTK